MHNLNFLQLVLQNAPESVHGGDFVRDIPTNNKLMKIINNTPENIIDNKILDSNKATEKRSEDVLSGKQRRL